MTLGPTCVRGHERAVHERLYPQPGSDTPNRKCMACRALFGKQHRTPLPVSTLELLSQEEMVRRIEAVRRAE